MRARYPEVELAADRAIHILGLSAGAIGALVMIARVTVSAGALTFSAVAIYLLALLAMLAASAAHNCRQARAGKELCRRLDHAAIFALIAGTYTPFTLTVLSGGLAIGVTAALWTAALGGAVTKLRYPLRFERLSIVVYLLFGWQGLFLVPPLFAALPEPTAVLIVTGGVLYSVGTAFHIWTRLPFQNAIWHGFVVLAAGCHYAAIWQTVLLVGARP
jgi:hemolysin III